jgi:hypothetical protein
MRPLAALASILAIAPGALSVSSEMHIIATYKDGTPDVQRLIDQATSAIREAGGQIKHKFDLIP